MSVKPSAYASSTSTYTAGFSSEALGSSSRPLERHVRGQFPVGAGVDVLDQERDGLAAVRLDCVGTSWGRPVDPDVRDAREVARVAAARR